MIFETVTLSSYCTYFYYCFFDACYILYFCTNELPWIYIRVALLILFLKLIGTSHNMRRETVEEKSSFRVCLL